MEYKEKLKTIVKNKRVVGAIFAGVLLVLFLGIAGVYFLSVSNKFAYKVLRYFPAPAIWIQKAGVITSREIISDTEAVRSFYLNQDFSLVGMRVDFSTEEGQIRLKVKEKGVLDKLIENRIIEKLAKERGIEINRQDAQRELNKKVQTLGNADVLSNNLRKLYHWSLDDFRDKVVIPQLYQKKLIEYYYTKIQPGSEGYKKIGEAKKELKADGTNFETVAKKYSEGESAGSGGALGWFRREQLVPQVAEQVMELPVKSITDVIQSPLGFHIVMVEEVRDVDIKENNEEMNPLAQQQDGKVKEVRLRQIFVRDGGFINWFEEEKKKVEVNIFMKEYSWDKETGTVKFTDESLAKAEQLVREKADGDPSMK